MIIIKAMVVLSTTLFNLLQFGVLYSWLKFAFDNCITFNGKGTVCITFDKYVHENECVKLNDKSGTLRLGILDFFPFFN